MTRIIRVSASAAALIVAAALVLAQGDSRRIPTWPEDGRMPPGMERQYVFMARGGDALILIMPGSTEQKRVPLNNQIIPVARSKVARTSANEYQYSYEVCNTEAAKDPIEIFGIPVPLGRSRLCMTHRLETGTAWKAPCFDSVPEILWRRPGTGYQSWLTTNPASGVTPGRCLGGFTIASDLLPGVKTGIFAALAVRFAPERMEWPEEVLDQVASYEERSWFERYTPVIAPTFSPDQPAAEIAAQLSKQIREFGDPQAPFVKELLAALRTAPPLRVSGKPSGPFEVELLQACTLALGREGGRD
jgi:hypothetical protein